MKLENMAFVARPRSPWEAVDLGLHMARAWWGPLCLAWLVLAVPVSLLLWLLPIPTAWLPWLIWWLKPLFERPQLYILSRAVFGTVPSLRDTLRALPAMMSSQWFSSLTWRRLSPSRSYDLPLVMLEGAGGKTRQQRIALLHQHQYSQSFWLTLIGYHLEIVLVLAGLAILSVLMPMGESGTHFTSLVEQEVLLAVIYLVVMALIAPFYVAGGFALYLNRRIHLEGWDIELVFRRLATRQGISTQVSVLLLAGFCLFSLVPASPVWASDETAQVSEIIGSRTEDLSPETVRSGIKDVLQSEELQEKKTIKLPKFLAELEEAERKPPPGINLDWVPNLARVIEWLAWLLLIILVVFVALRYRSWLGRFVKRSFRRDSIRPPQPEILFGLDVRESSVPQQLSGAVWALWQKAEHREAVGLLYRATLSRLIHQKGFEFQASDTEADCLRKVQARGEVALNEYCSQLTRIWQDLAYGHRVPDSNAVQALCQAWDSLFAEADRAS